MEDADRVGSGFRTALGVPEPKRLADVRGIDDEQAMAELFGFSRAAEIEPLGGDQVSGDHHQPDHGTGRGSSNALKTIGLVIFFILLVITMVGITNTFRMILIERTKEIGTMRAFGMQRHVVRNVFLMEALLLSAGVLLWG